MRSPHVRSCEWGRVEIDGVGVVKDAKLWPGGGRAWDWNETGTRHEPGIQPEDVAELLAHGARTVVLGCGMLGALGVTDAAMDVLDEEGVTVHVAPTEQAVALYEELAAYEPVGALFHSTC